MSATFNVYDLSPYYGEHEELLDIDMEPLLIRGNDAGTFN